MRKILLALLLSLIVGTPASAQFAEVHDAATNNSASLDARFGRSVSQTYVPGGHFSIMVDDGYAWTVKFADSLAAINADAGLTGTNMELGFTVIFNARNGPDGTGNGISDWDGNPTASTICTEADVRKLSGYSFVDLGSHGYTEDIAHAYSADGGNTMNIPTIFGTVGGDSTTMEEMFVGIRNVLVDTLGVITQDRYATHGMNGHKTEPLARYNLIKVGAKNIRVGTWRWRPESVVGTTGLPIYRAIIPSMSTTLKRGTHTQFNRHNLDVFSYWQSAWDPNAIDMYSYLSPYMVRTYLMHTNPAAPAGTHEEWGDGPNNDGTGFDTDAERWADLMETIRRCADTNSMVIFTMHNLDGGTQAFYDDGAAGPGITEADSTIQIAIDSLSIILRREIVPLALNGLLGRDGPVLYSTGVAKAIEMRKSWSSSSVPTLIHRNPYLLEGVYDDDVPFGWAAACTSWWADSSWAYVDSTDAAAADDWFGMDNKTGLIAGTTDASTGLFHNLILGVWPVRPNSYVDLSFYASASQLRSQADADSMYAAEWMDIKITEFRYNGDPTDSTFTFGVGSAADGPEELVWDVGARQSGLHWRNPEVAAGTTSYEKKAMTGSFHSHDSWTNLRANFAAVKMYRHRASVVGANDEGQRWREHKKIHRVSPFTDWIKVEVIPTGFTAHPAPGATAADKDSLAISGVVIINTD